MNIFKASCILFVASLFAAPFLNACSSDGERATADDNGALGLRLLVNDRQVNTVHYQITRAGLPVAIGDLNVATASSLTFRIGGLPAGDDYEIALSATTADGVQSCSGSAAFSVLAGRVTSVSVVLNCRDVMPGNGSIDVDGEFNQCPAFSSMVVYPLEAYLGETISLHATGTDVDPGDVLAYEWSEGGFPFASTANATYTCIVEGVHELVGSISDGDCSTGESVAVRCTVDESAICGNGILEDLEECDDGNGIDGDGCDSICRIEACGNGRLDLGEACDDGNTVDGDGCSATCGLEPVCGNGIVEDGEACDDGNTVDGDGCSATCGLEPACGNGIVEDGEACDDGNTVDGDGCSATCGLEPACGNGIVEDGEACDDGNTVDGDGCSATCGLEPVCGNGIVEDGEACDDGNTVDGDGCSATCGLEPVCGNGIVEDGEACDDGNTVDGDGCSATCQMEAVCGNGIVEDGEACDDGNTVDGDGCSATCQMDAVCGNGIVEDGEVCDDGNTQDGDGCSGDCLIIEEPNATKQGSKH